MAAKEKKKFEEAVEELEGVVEQLESGELGNSPWRTLWRRSRTVSG